MGKVRKAHHRLTLGDHQLIYRLVLAGETQHRIAAAVGCCAQTVQALLARTGGLPPRGATRSERRLSGAEREEISRGMEAGHSCRALARQLGRAPSTISREVRANAGRRRYRAGHAERRAQQQARRPKVAKLAADPVLRQVVEAGLTQRWSPQQIAERLQRDYPQDARMRVSAETIYQSLYIYPRGALRRDLVAALRTGRTQRKARQRGLQHGRLRDMVPIAARPPEAADRAVPGHWEGDLLLGRASQSAISTLVERRSRYVMLLRLPEGRQAQPLRKALAAKMRTLPATLRRTLTWDQGKEMADHVRFSVATGIPVYFCDPHSPWQRGSNENTHGLLRQYLPHGADLRTFTQRQLDAIARELNGRPRQTLGWATPAEAFTTTVATTA